MGSVWLREERNPSTRDDNSRFLRQQRGRQYDLGRIVLLIQC